MREPSAIGFVRHGVYMKRNHFLTSGNRRGTIFVGSATDGNIWFQGGPHPRNCAMHCRVLRTFQTLAVCLVASRMMCRGKSRARRSRIHWGYPVQIIGF